MFRRKSFSGLQVLTLLGSGLNIPVVSAKKRRKGFFHSLFAF